MLIADMAPYRIRSYGEYQWNRIDDILLRVTQLPIELIHEILLIPKSIIQYYARHVRKTIRLTAGQWYLL